MNISGKWHKRKQQFKRLRKVVAAHRKDPQAVGRQVLYWNPQGRIREEDFEESGRIRDWESVKDLERSWSLHPKQDPPEMLPVSPVLLKE
jgi:hypothetical protein